MNAFLHTLKIKKICISFKVSIQPCRPKSDSALPGAIWAQFRPEKLNQKAIPAHGRAYFSPGIKSAQLIGLYWPWFKGVKLDSKIGLYFTHRNGPIYFLGLKQIFLIYSVIIRYCTRPVFAPSCAIGLVLKQRVDGTQKSKPAQSSPSFLLGNLKHEKLN